jgi:hypothetical protein
MNVLNKIPQQYNRHDVLKFGEQAEFDQRLIPVVGNPDRSYAVIDPSFAIPGQNVTSACPSNFLTVQGVKNAQTGKTYANFQAANIGAATTSASLITAFILVGVAVLVAVISWFMPASLGMYSRYAGPLALVLLIIAGILFIKDRNDKL